ncbi:MAG: phosphoribosylformylglycinamidine synthase [Oscillospiraceae bacterium]|nr:phosphoribosylformylglycinamidine synthase [Oscillospiraceae bacterium]
MVYRIFVEKKPGQTHEADKLLKDVQEFLQIASLKAVRVINRYDVENIDEALFENAVRNVFSEPQVDNTYAELDAEGIVFAVEPLPGQFDQRADSAAQCIQIISQGERPLVRTAKVYVLTGELTADELAAIRKYVINPVECREAALEKPETLVMHYEIPSSVATVEGFLELDRAGLENMAKSLGLAMDAGDLEFCQGYFKTEGRCPTITEIRMIDTYWSDHCRHTTFNTIIDNVSFADPLLQSAWQEYLDTRAELNRTKPTTLMDIGTLAGKWLRKNGMLEKLYESEEINACTVRMTVNVDGEDQPWLLLFKNETHNHPTEIEPFGGAATCIGGAIRDPLASRAYVYGAMRVTGAADPLKPVDETITGKLPQRKIVTTAAAGYSSYGNQIGLATGMVDEIYHPGYAAKRMEIGAVVGAVHEDHSKPDFPAPGDKVILLGGRTGRDGIGGATGSSKAHNVQSVETCGSEVQKGNAPEERKLQRLFRNGEAAVMIKRCNDFGAGGVSVAIGELADGLDIDLNKIPKKYEGLDGTELAIAESQERMAIVVAAHNVPRFLEIAATENLEATVVATVTDTNRLVMHWNGATICDVSRDFLNSNGAEKHIDIKLAPASEYEQEITGGFVENFQRIASDLNTCSKRGLSERFDSTIGAGTVLMPFGGKYQHTPIQAMVHKVSLEKGHTDDCSVMSWGYNPFITEHSPYHGAYLAVVESAAKLVATGAKYEDVYLTFQEYFQRVGNDPKRWGQPLAALLGAFNAQMDLKIAAIGGKDSMSGTFEDLDVPPTLVSFAVTTEKVQNIVSNEFKAPGHKVCLLKPEYDANGLPVPESLLGLFDYVTELLRSGKAVSAYTPGMGGVGEAVMKMAFGNWIGVNFNKDLSMRELFGHCYGSFVLEMAEGEVGKVIGETTKAPVLHLDEQNACSLDMQLALYENKLEDVFPCNIPTVQTPIETVSFNAEVCKAPAVKVARPKVLIPVFPGTNCEYDSAKAMTDAGAEAEIFVIRNLTADAIASSVEEFANKLKEAQMVFVPGGFSGGDEPDGSGKFITAFFRNAAVKEQITDLLDNRDGLMLGICNGFQALVKLGLVPYGKIMDSDCDMPTLTYNVIGRHQSRVVRTRVASNMSPWLRGVNVGDVFNVPISHGEGRFFASEETVRELAKNGQIATQYVDLLDNTTADVHFNPNGSIFAIEGITSPDGRVFGKMGHSERKGFGLYKNIPGEFDMKLFESAVKYFKG